MNTGEVAPQQPTVLNQEAWHERFGEQVAAAAANSAPLSVLFIDVNNFKEINDSLGHDIGDEVVAGITNVLGDYRADFLVAGRIGGDEFAVSGDANLEMAQQIRHELREVFDKFLATPAHEKLLQLGVGFAIGTATYKPGMTASELLRAADQDMYIDKESQLPELTPKQQRAVAVAMKVLEKVGLQPRLRDLRRLATLEDDETVTTDS